jgi:hypothetical protein
MCAILKKMLLGKLLDQIGLGIPCHATTLGHLANLLVQCVEADDEICYVTSQVCFVKPLIGTACREDLVSLPLEEGGDLKSFK